MKRTLMISCFLISVLVFMGWGDRGSAQQGTSLSTSTATGKIAEIESYVKEVDAYVKANAKSQRIFADVSPGTEAGPAKWGEFKTDKEREAADTGDNLNENAYAWTRDGKLVGANFTFQSPSRDWVHYVMYYFRPDGTLAKSDATLNTFQGDVTVIRQDFYSAKGVALKGTTHCKDLKTQKAKPCGNYQDQLVPLYKTVNEVPFYGLLKK
jgi:hypothetical protein